MPRKKIDALVEYAKSFGAKGLAYIAINEDGTYKSSFAKFMKDEEMAALVAAMDGNGGGVAHATHHGTGFISEDVAEEVVREDHIKTARVRDQEDGGCVDMLVIVSDLGIFLTDLVYNALPHIAGVDEYVLLVHQSDVLRRHDV